MRSRRNSPIFPTILAALAIAATFGTAAIRFRTRLGKTAALAAPAAQIAPTRLPMLCFTTTDGGAPAATRIDWARSFSYIFPNLDPPARAELTNVLTGYAARLEAQVNPLLDDLFDGDPKDDLVRWARAHGPLVQTSIALATTTFVLEGPRGVALTLNPPPNATCRDAWAPSDQDDDLRHARFAAWPLGASLLVRVTDAAARSCVRDALRARVAAGDAIGVTVDGSEPAPLTADESALTRRVLALEVLSRKSAGKEGSTIASATIDTTGVAPKLASTDLLVVPRLAAITRWGTLRTEIEQGVARCTSGATVFSSAAFP